MKTPKTQYADGHINTQATDYIREINLKWTGLFNPKNGEDFGRFFKGGLQCCDRGYLATVYDYNESRREQEKTLTDFLKFISTTDYFILEKLDEYKSYVKEKFGWQL